MKAPKQHGKCRHHRHLCHSSGKGAVTFFASTLLTQSGITNAFCTRHHGVSSKPYESLNFSSKEGDTHANIEHNKDIVADAFGFSAARLVTVNQVHGDNILVLDTDMLPEQSPLEYDAIITSRRSLAIGIKTADCVPILLVDPVMRVIAAVHAGWKGTALTIVQKVVETMATNFSSHRENIIAAIGPSIGKCCYEVGMPVYQQLCPAGEYATNVLPSVKDEHWMLDLKGINRAQLLSARLSPNNIDVFAHCTACLDKLFFSHRRDNGKTGRMLNFIMLK